MAAAAPRRPTFWQALRARSRVTIGVMIQQIKRHGGGARLSFPMSVVDMSGRIVILALVFSIIGRRPAFGDSVVLFMVTGVIPFMLFLRATQSVTRTELQGGTTASPLTTTATFALAHVLSTTIIAIVSAALICFAMHLLGIRYAIPSQPLYCALAFLLMALLSFGFGLFNAMVSAIFPPWASIFRVSTRGLFLLSGIFYVTDFMPYMIRQYLVWNPLVHGVTLNRLGFYENHPTLVLDVPYLATWGVLLTLFGLAAHRVFRRRFR